LIATRQGIDTPGGDVGEFSTITKGPIPVSGYFLVSGLIEDALTAFAFGWGHGAVAEWRAAFFGYACGHCGVALMRVDQANPTASWSTARHVTPTIQQQADPVDGLMA
jgi:hypothetical protein